MDISQKYVDGIVLVDDVSMDAPIDVAKELAKIFLRKAEKRQYAYNADVRASIVDIMEAAVREKDKNFGKARFVRNIFEKAIQRPATHLSTVAPLASELTLHGLGFAYEG